MITEEKSNFVKCCKLLGTYCKGVMFNIVQRTTNVPLEEFDLKKIRLNPEEPWCKVIFELINTKKEMVPVEKDFDLSSLYIFLRYICTNIDQPRNGWGNTPSHEDVSMGDDIERIRHIRNKILTKFGKAAEIPNDDFKQIAPDLKGVILRLESSYGGMVYKHTLDRIDSNESEKNEKWILREFLNSCETAVDAGDTGIIKKDIESAKGTRTAAGMDPDEAIRKQDLILRQLKELVDELQGQINAANKRIDELEKENAELRNRLLQSE